MNTILFLPYWRNKSRFKFLFDLREGLSRMLLEDKVWIRGLTFAESFMWNDL